MHRRSVEKSGPAGSGGVPGGGGSGPWGGHGRHWPPPYSQAPQRWLSFPQHLPTTPFGPHRRLTLPPPPPQPQTPKLPSHSLSCTMYPTELSSSLLCFFFQLVFTLNFSLSHLMSLRPVSFVLACIHSACNWTLSTCIAYPERMRHMQGCAEGCRAQPLSW